MKKTQIFILVYALSSIFTFSSTYGMDSITAQNHNDVYQEANKMLDINADTALNLFNKLIPYYTKCLNTEKRIQCYIGLSDAYKTKGQYSKAYEHLWDALLLGEKENNPLIIIDIHIDLSGLYRIYKRYDKCQQYLKTALQLSKDNSIKKGYRLANIYYGLAIVERNFKNYDKALDYLNTCMRIRKKEQQGQSEFSYIDSERGNIYLEMGQLDNAEKYLLRSHPYFIKNNLNFAVKSSLSLGDLYVKKKNIYRANEYYKESLSQLQKMNSHTDVHSELLAKLAQTNRILGNTSIAYDFLEEANVLIDSLFNARTSVNNELFQIKNKHEETIRKKDEEIKTHLLAIEHNKLIQSRLKLLIFFILFVIVVGIVVIRMRLKLRKADIVKKEMELQAKFEHDKAEAIMKMKNRELTSNTLQMIEKDKHIYMMLEKLKSASVAEYKSMKRLIVQGKNGMWEQFNKRFTEVNQGFYERLRKQHPDLTPTELKHCALIKLNFNSKEMSRLLSISLNSVNISRHRIRKKMYLQREDNLSIYIAAI
ncbi:hypothetical protein BW723_12870 [Polaribacter reichenbachii]|uniref:Uncharacterized protein n=1 Tax=Polaribacter reichenbachii TaxID=996801 RepID=A0A1B8U047_9FLAO|nr:tetratricopeptide repeat protein [Polaribacter reichenbachii]APZ47120.1 hypothetical protein BW723_12870 [Polaribacter reichenbachii]AUC17761.1 hypothetical protein BTO17_03320 [Polaribacter reichenbachii]OBY65216.1 hypothetical protein LPB301_08910 [Polaribacter reichenbachii]